MGQLESLEVAYNAENNKSSLEDRMSLEIDISEDPKGKRIALGGHLDTTTASRLQFKIDESIDESAHTVILDLARLEFLSSAGLRVIFKTKKLMDRRKGKLLLLNLQPQVRMVFEIIKALDGMNVFASQEEMDDYLATMQNKVLAGED
jgi:anti-anti-sigma factor